MPYQIGYYEVGHNPDVAGEYAEETGASRALAHQHPSYRAPASDRFQPRQHPSAYPFPGLPVRDMSPTKDREWPLGFDSATQAATGIAAGATLNITQQPQAIFRPERFVVAASVAPNFVVNDIKVGNLSQFLAPGAVPAEGFTNTSFGVRLRMDTAQISQIISVNVTNISLAAARFLGMMIGVAVQ